MAIITSEPEVQGTIDAVQKSHTDNPTQSIMLTFDQQESLVSPSYPSPVEWRDRWIYFLMIDRFNNNQQRPRHEPYDEPYHTFQGGTFNGVKAQIPYLKQLGVGAIWLTPVLKNCLFDTYSYHGYGIQDFIQIDPRFGTEKELRELIDEAHAHDIPVIFDVVINHTGDLFAYQKQDGGHPQLEPTADFRWEPYPVAWRDNQGHPQVDWDSVLDTPNREDSGPRPEELRHDEYFRRQGKMGPVRDIGDFESLKDLQTEQLQLQNILVNAYQYLIAKYNIDAFRIDTLKHVSPDFARIFANAIREFALTIGKHNFFIFGEVADTEETIAEFIGRYTSQRDGPIGADAALDFPLFYLLPSVLKGFAAPLSIAGMYHHRKQIQQTIMSTHGEASNFFVTFLDNHDQNRRFYSQTADHQYDNQVTLGLACLFSLQGIPCVYYGTEQGLHGSGNSDQAVREALWGKQDAFNQKHPFYEALQKISEVRRKQPALRYGRQYFRPLSGNGQQFSISPFTPGVLAFSRILSDQEVIIVANATPTPQQVYVIVDWSLHADGDQLAVLYRNQPTSPLPEPVLQLHQGQCMIHEVDGTITSGPVRCVRVTLASREVQILKKL